MNIYKYKHIYDNLDSYFFCKNKKVFFQITEFKDSIHINTNTSGDAIPENRLKHRDHFIKIELYEFVFSGACKNLFLNPTKPILDKSIKESGCKVYEELKKIF